jgi:hypothetical protein
MNRDLFTAISGVSSFLSKQVKAVAGRNVSKGLAVQQSPNTGTFSISYVHNNNTVVPTTTGHCPSIKKHKEKLSSFCHYIHTVPVTCIPCYKKKVLVSQDL